MHEQKGRSAFVLVVGRPSSGKSTLVNALCGHKVSIVSPTPQTTRNAIRGIVTTEAGQLVLVDTPGMHDSTRAFNLRLRDVVTEQTSECDIVLYTLDAARPTGEEEALVARTAGASGLPVVVVLTRSDLEEPSHWALPFLTTVGWTPAAILQTRSLHEPGPHIEEARTAVTDALMALASEGDPWYPDEYYTDQDPSFRIAEIIREQAIARAREELPHALYVEVADLEQRDKTLWARAFIIVERPSQQGILVGRNGSVIGAIRRDAERELRGIFPTPVKLSLQIKVRGGWRHDRATLDRLLS